MPHKETKETRNRKTGREIIQLCDQVTCSLLFFSFLYSCTHHPFPLNIFVSLCIQMQFLNKHFPPSAPGLDPVRTIVELLPLLLLDGNCLWAFITLCSLSLCVCVFALLQGVSLYLFAGVFACGSQSERVTHRSVPLHLHSRCVLLHPSTYICVTSAPILSPLCCSVTTAPASASNCL